MQEIGAFIMITALAVIIAIILIAFMNFLLRWKIVSSGHVDDHILQLLKKPSDKYTMLRWGILLLFGGIGLIVLHFVPAYADQSPLPWGVEAIFLSAGFLLYYLIIRKEK
jgi:hypothetical protein